MDTLGPGGGVFIYGTVKGIGVSDDGPTTIKLPPIQLRGIESLVLTAKAVASYPFQTSRIEVVCASGRRYTSSWRGIPIEALAETVELPPETTHIAVESDDGHRSCVDVATAIDGLLAFYKDDSLLTETSPYASRFVADGVDGKRMTKDVRAIEAVNLSPGTNPCVHETIKTESPTVGETE